MKKYYKLLLAFLATIVISFHQIPISNFLHLHIHHKAKVKQVKQIKIIKKPIVAKKIEKVVEKVETKAIIPLVTILKGNITTKKAMNDKITKDIENDTPYTNIIISYYTNSVENSGKTDGIGANNIPMDRGYIAMPEEFGYGTRVLIDGKIYINQDRGEAIKRINFDTIKIDVYIPNATQKELMKMGIKHTKGQIIK